MVKNMKMHNRNDKNIDKVDKIYILWGPPKSADHMTVIQTMIIYIGCGSNMCNLIWLTCRPCGVPIENQRGQGGGLRLFWNRVIKTTHFRGPHKL